VCVCVLERELLSVAGAVDVTPLSLWHSHTQTAAATTTATAAEAQAEHMLLAADGTLRETAASLQQVQQLEKHVNPSYLKGACYCV